MGDVGPPPQERGHRERSNSVNANNQVYLYIAQCPSIFLLICVSTLQNYDIKMWSFCKSTVRACYPKFSMTERAY